MKNKNKVRHLSWLLALVLLVAAVLVGCGDQDKKNEDTGVSTESLAATEVGEGQYTFTFTATFADETKQVYAVSTNEENVGKALLELSLIGGDESEYGLYVKTVCGVLADYDADKTYWALYTDGEMSMVGVDGVKCADVASVEFRLSK